ncbi:hypothetical protein CMUS01_15813 [Colletotrichum musicola]|uniref:Uncharacterized protein n=1 Tax=Colletotrichum musicola TaxID=2175873 RepID=A0A8H6ML24_9PEZI|nr:hypothetical protein CMUS01_15813 [Colletotrichum musicola]
MKCFGGISTAPRVDTGSADGRESGSRPRSPRARCVLFADGSADITNLTKPAGNCPLRRPVVYSVGCCRAGPDPSSENIIVIIGVVVRQQRRGMLLQIAGREYYSGSPMVEPLLSPGAAKQ